MSATMYGSTPGAGTGQAIFTDDVSLQVFMDYLKRLVSLCFLSPPIIPFSSPYLFIPGCRCSDELIYPPLPLD